MSEAQASDRVAIHLGDSALVLRDLPSSSIDTIITDPPYGLSFMGKGWDSVLPDAAIWRECLRVTKPGAMMLAFGGTRTFHRLACAIEDAGWEIRDTVMWLYGQGFPKSLDISKAIDKEAGAEREVIEDPKGRNRCDGNPCRCPQNKILGRTKHSPATAPATAPATEWAGWGTALKPAWEPIIMAMKPLDSTFARNALAHGVAGINVDGCRIAGPDGAGHWSGDDGSDVASRPGFEGGFTSGGRQAAGRWPSNVILSHHPDCERYGTEKVKSSPGGSFQREKTSRGLPGGSFGQERAADREKTDLQKPGCAGSDGTESVESWACHPECPVRILDEQAGERISGTLPAGTQREGIGWRGGMGCTVRHSFVGSSGGASRFFYCAKASGAERFEGNKHPTVKPIALLEYLCRLTATPTGGVVLDPFMGSGSVGLAALVTRRRFVGIERDPESFEIARKRFAEQALQVKLF